MQNQNVGSKATDEWLQSQKSGTRSSYKTYWRYFVEYTKMNGDQILEDRKKDKEYRWEHNVLTFKDWVQENKNLCLNSAASAAMAVRSFFSYHRFPLQFRRSEKKRIKERRRKTEDYRFNREDLKKMVDVGNLAEKYIVAAGKSFGLRSSDFLNLRRGDLEPYLDRDPPISIGEYNTKKENVVANPFIDTDALPIIKLVIDQMNREGRTKPTDKMLRYKDSITVSRTLQRIADKAGIQYSNKRVRFHCLRKFLIDHLSSFMSESKWKQVVGKQIDEKAYVSTDSLRDDYARAMVETTFAKSVSNSDVELMAKKQALLMIAKLQGLKESEIKTIFRQKSRVIGRALTIQEETETLEEEVEKTNAKIETDGGCKDGKHCQRIIDENDLPKLLTEGWYYVATLPSGKIVVSND